MGQHMTLEQRALDVVLRLEKAWPRIATVEGRKEVKAIFADVKEIADLARNVDACLNTIRQVKEPDRSSIDAIIGAAWRQGGK